MRLTEIEFRDGLPVDGYGPGFFRVGGAVWRGAVAVTPDGVRIWGGWDDTVFPGIDVLLVGTGAAMAPLPPAFREALEGQGIGVEPMASASACRSYNMLLAEGRRVGLAALPV